MYKLHKPHIDSGYLAKVEFEKMADPEGEPDWNIWYFPGPRAKDEYMRFAAGKEQPPSPVEAGKTLLPRNQSPAEELVAHFLIARFGKAQRRIAGKELTMAETLIQDHGLEKAKRIIFDALASAIEAGTKPVWMTDLKTFIEEEVSKKKRRPKSREVAKKS